MKNFIDIGTYVRCNGRVKNNYVYDTYDRKIEKITCKIKGYIIGGTYLKEGTLIRGYEEGNSFHTTKTVFVYKVVPGFINKPILVLPEQILPNQVTKFPSACKFKASHLSEIERNKLSSYMKTIMKDWPRNKKGQWIKRVNRFEFNKQYRWIGPTDKLPQRWNSTMGFWFDGEPKTCLEVSDAGNNNSLIYARFEDKVSKAKWCYDINRDLKYFEEVI